MEKIKNTTKIMQTTENQTVTAKNVKNQFKINKNY